jgi:hypothetical protein
MTLTPEALIIADTGSGSSKAVVSAPAGSQLCEYGVASPYLLPCTRKEIEGVIDNFSMSKDGYGLNFCWLESNGEIQSVGKLAEKLAITEIAPPTVKQERAVWKALSVLGWVSTTKGIHDIALAIPLPYEEYQDAEKIELRLHERLEVLSYCGSPVNANLIWFKALPEGMGHIFEYRRKTGFEGVVACLMLGHKDGSLFWQYGKTNAHGGKTANLGMRFFAERVAAKAGRYPIDQLACCIAEAGFKVNPGPLRKILHSESPAEIKVELDILRSAIAEARIEFWQQLKSWILRTLPPDIEVIVIGGGTAGFWMQELKAMAKSELRNQTLNWYADAKQEIQAMLGTDNESLAIRFIDASGILFRVNNLWRT